MADVELSTLGDVIKAAYEGQTNTNAFTDPEKAKLADIEEKATKNASDATLLDRANHMGTQTAGTIVDLPDLLADKVTVVPGKGLSDANFTQDEKNKLAQLEGAHFKGVHIGLAALEAAHPVAVAGDYAVVDDGTDLLWYQWETGTSEWVARVGESTEVTPAQVKAYYESNPDTNAFTDDEKAGLSKLINEERFTLRRIGTWNAATNTPPLTDGTGTPGDFYVITTPGSQNFGTGMINFRYQDWVLYFGGVWNRLITTDAAVAWADVTNKPKLYSPRGTISLAIPAVRMRISTVQPIAPSSVVKVTGWASGYDQFGMLSGGDFIIPAWATHARVSASLNIDSIQEGKSGRVRIDRNGTTVAQGASPGAGSAQTVTPNANTGIIPVASGDAFSIHAWHNADSAKYVNSGESTFVNIELYESLT